MPAVITVYSLDGTALAPVSITLNGSETRNLDIKALAPDQASKQNLGGVSISFTGATMGVGAQITISGHNGFGNVDAPLLADSTYKSNSIDAVWWAPAHAHSYLILGNSSADTLKVDLTYGAGKQDQVKLAPHATVLQKVDDGSDDLSLEAVDSVHVTAPGDPGALRLTGYTISDDEHFVSTIQAFDPASSTEPAIYANGLHFSGGTNHMVVKNASTQALRISATIFPLKTDSSPGTISISPTAVMAGATAELDLSGIVGKQTEFDGAAVKVESTGSAGSVIASFVHHDRQGRVVRSSIFKDIGDPAVSTGSYPWRLDGQFQTSLYITNVGKVRAAFGGHIVPAEGPSYLIDSHYLDVGETAVFDLRQIRDQQIPDPKGVRLPKQSIAAQFEWTTIFGDGTQRLIGKSESVDESSSVSAISSNASCNCIGANTDASINFDILNAFIGYPFPDIVVDGTSRNICTGIQTQYTIVPTAWYVDSPNILSVTLNSGQTTSTLTGLEPGTSKYHTLFYQDTWDPVDCVLIAVQVPVPATGNVVAPPTQMSVSKDAGNTVSNKCAVAAANGRVRNITYQLSNADGNVGSVPIQEAFIHISANTCGNPGPTPSSCSASTVSASGTFTDILETNACAPANPSCGFSITPDQWQFCGGATPTPLGSPTYVIDWNNITINGSNLLAPGTLIAK
jgi:hypothetical protein